jgi:LmbE family N-acetylglucosaminyl deacetylase
MGNKTVLIVAAHADDEALGCGGTIARHTAEGDVVHAVFMTDGVNSRKTISEIDLIRRIDAASKAHEILGLTQVIFLELPDNSMDSIPLLQIVQTLEAVILNIAPQVIYTHHYGDLNIDHSITHKAVMTACRPLPGCTTKEIYSFEVVSSTEWATPSKEPFLPNYFVDISGYLDQKIRALEAYELEMRAVPHSRSIEHAECLARHRGNSVGVGAAEAFMSIRQII